MKLKKILIATSLALTCNLAFATDLMDIYKEAFVKDPIVLKAKAQREEAMAKISEATAALLPQINVIGSIGKTYTSVNPQTNSDSDRKFASAGVNLTQALWRGSAWSQRSVATKNAAMQDLLYNDQLQNLILRTSEAYFGVLQSKDTLRFQMAKQAALKQQLDEATRRFQVGLIAETDQLEAQAAYDLAEAQVITARNNLINSYEAVHTIVGRAVNDLATLNEKKFAPAALTKTLDQIVKRAEINNLRLQANIVGREMAKSAVRLAQTGHEPSLDLVGSASTSYTEFDKEIQGYQKNGNKHEANIGLNLNIPIFAGGATSARVRQAEQKYIAASEDLELTHRNMIAQLNSGFNNVNASIRSIRAYTQLANSAKSALKATKAGYNVGTRTITDVLDATQRMYDAKQNLAMARYAYILAHLRLHYTQGILTVADLEAINRALVK